MNHFLNGFSDELEKVSGLLGETMDHLEKTWNTFERVPNAVNATAVALESGIPGAAIGGIIGGTIGAAKDGENPIRGAAKGALLGSGIGGAIASGISGGAAKFVSFNDPKIRPTLSTFVAPGAITGAIAGGSIAAGTSDNDHNDLEALIGRILRGAAIGGLSGSSLGAI